MVQDGDYQHVKQQDRGRNGDKAKGIYALFLRTFHHNLYA